MAGSPTWCARELFSPTVWGFLFTGNRVSPLGFEGRVGRSDGGAVAAFEDEGGGDGRLDDVGAGCFGDLFGSQVVLSERPQGDGSLFLIDNHGVVFICDWGDSGFRPRADDASAVPFLVVVVVAVDEVVNVHIEAISEQVPAIGERGCGLDGDVCAVGEGDGVSRGAAVAVARVHDLLACEQLVEGAGVVLGGVGVDSVEHGVSPVWVCFLVWLHCSMLCGRVHGVSRPCVSRIGRVFGRVGGARAREWLYVTGEAKRRERGGNREGRRLTNDLRPSPRVRPCVYLRALGFYLWGSLMVVWVAAASPLMERPSLRSMVRPWCAVRPL